MIAHTISLVIVHTQETAQHLQTIVMCIVEQAHELGIAHIQESVQELGCLRIREPVLSLALGTFTDILLHTILATTKEL
jgi:hypothetical protein